FDLGPVSRTPSQLGRPELTNLRVVFGVGDVLHPGHVGAVERLLHRDVDHTGGRRSAVPVLLARGNEDDFAWLDLADWAALGLHPTDARDHVKRLTERMAMPRRPRARLESDAAGDDAHRRLRRDDRILPDGAGEAFARSPACRARACEMNVHGIASLFFIERYGS